MSDKYAALKSRIEKALEDFTNGRASMHVPVLDTDIDLVLYDCLELLAERDADRARIAELEAQAFAHDRLCDSNYIAGMKTGWNLGIANDNAGFNQCLAARVRRWPDDSDSLKIEGE